VTKLLVAALVLCGCHHRSTCERYAEMEATCGDVGQAEMETTRTLARGMCEAAASSDPELAKAAAKFAREAECAEQAGSNCPAYKHCRDAEK
jgi:hypothetical protein